MAPRTYPTQNGTSNTARQTAQTSTLLGQVLSVLHQQASPAEITNNSTTIIGEIDAISAAETPLLAPPISANNEKLPNVNSKSYKIITGLFQDAPVIVVSSEFLPFSVDGQSPNLGSDTIDRGYALNAKEKAQLLTANNAVRIISYKEETKKYLEDTKKNLLDFTNTQFSRGNELIAAIDQATNILSVKNFSHVPLKLTIEKKPIKGQDQEPGADSLNLANLSNVDSISISDEPVSFESYLKALGLNPNNLLSSTALYQQFLLELKRSLLTHTPFLNSSIISAPTPSDPIKKSYYLRGLFTSTDTNPIKSNETNNESDGANLFRRLSLVKIFDLRTPSGTSDIQADLTAADINSRSLFSLIDGRLSDFADPVDGLEAENALTIKTSYDVFQDKLGVSLEAKDAYFARFFTNTYNLQNVSNLDFKTLSCLLSKEILFSRALSNSSIRSKLDALAAQEGLSGVSTLNNSITTNFKIWDLVIGNKFLKNTLDLSNAKIIQTDFATDAPRDLLGLSRARIKNFKGDTNEYSVLSFENNDLPVINDDDYKLTHGSLYYVDSSLQVTKNFTGDVYFNTDKLNILKNSISNSKNSLKLIKQIYSGDSSNDESNKSILELLQKNSGESDPIVKIFSRLQPLQDTYKKTFQISSGKVVFSSELRKNVLSSSDSKFIAAATIFKKAATESSREAKLIEKLLFHIVCREIYKSVTGNYYSYTKPANGIAQSYSPLFKTGIKGLNGYETYAGTAEQCIDLTLLRGVKYYLANAQTKDVESLLVNVPTQNRVPVYSSTLFNFTLITSQGAGGTIYPGLEPGTPKQNYLRFLGTGLDGNPEGLFKIVTDLMIEIYQDTIYRQQNDVNTSNITYYGGYEQTHILWMYFKLICQAISIFTPDKILGLYSINKAGETTAEEGYIIAPDKDNPPSSLYSLTEEAIKDNDVNLSYPSKVNTRIKWYKQEKIRIANYIDIVDQFVSNVNSKMENFSNLLQGNFMGYLNETIDVFSKDASLTQQTRNELIKESFSREQIILSEHIMSEFIDRFGDSNNSEAVLRTFPDFNSWQEKFMNFAPINDVNLISYSALSNFFQDSKFFKEEGANKRIFSIGIPPRLVRNLVGTPGGTFTSQKENLKSNIVKISIYKYDVLRPGVIFEPKVFLFEMNRFPTRIATNWSAIKEIKETKDILKVPTKFFNGSQFILHKNRQEAYLDYPGGGFFPSDDRTSAYSNHVWSYLLEEYIRWFTRMNIGESSYYQYSGVNSTSNMLNNQYNSYLSTTSNNFNFDNIPIDLNNLSSDDPQVLLKEYSDTVKSYLRNETLFLNFEEFRRRVLYPKKFDRVFNVIIDPDDFKIYSIDNFIADYYKTATDEKKVIKYENNQWQWIGKLGTKDTYIEEYWATIEPYVID